MADWSIKRRSIVPFLTHRIFSVYLSVRRTAPGKFSEKVSMKTHAFFPVCAVLKNRNNRFGPTLMLQQHLEAKPTWPPTTACHRKILHVVHHGIRRGYCDKPRNVIHAFPFKTKEHSGTTMKTHISVPMEKCPNNVNHIKTFKVKTSSSWQYVPKKNKKCGLKSFLFRKRCG